MYLILDTIPGNSSQEIEMEEFKMKEEILPGSTVEDTCTIYVQGESMKMEGKKKALSFYLLPTQKNHNFNILLYFKVLQWK